MAMVSAARLRAACEQRAAVQAHIRAFFAARSVLEVETPLLSGAANPEPNIEPFATTFSGHVGHGARERWLPPSPEFERLAHAIVPTLRDAQRLVVQMLGG